jgi:molecular chaperone GrpE
VTVKKDVSEQAEVGTTPEINVSEGPSPAAEAPAPNLPAEPTDSALERVSAERDELKDRLLRLAAEYDNFRKRSQKERAEIFDRAQADFLGSLLDELDDLDRVVEGGEKSASVADLHQAVQLIDKKIWKQLEKNGMESVEPLGQPFDPNFHEAISQIPAPSAEQAGSVAMVFQIGYRYKGILLRPARVQVYGEPA